MRLFIAISFGPETRARLIALREELRACARRGNFTRDENLHLTLAFLGECDAGQTAAAKAAMDALHFAPFRATIDRLGRFRRGGGALWWAGLREDAPLMRLQGDLSKHLLGAGFRPDGRRYSPHITLGREVETEYAPWQIEAFGERVARIVLMRSERIGGKLTYTEIYETRGSGT